MGEERNGWTNGARQGLRFYARCIREAWRGSWDPANARQAVLAVLLLAGGAWLGGGDRSFPADFSFGAPIGIGILVGGGWLAVFLVQFVTAPPRLYARLDVEFLALTRRRSALSVMPVAALPAPAGIPARVLPDTVLPLPERAPIALPPPNPPLLVLPFLDLSLLDWRPLDLPPLDQPLLAPSLLDLPPVDLPASDLPLSDLAPPDLPLLDRPLLVLPLLDPSLLDLPPVDLPASDLPLSDLTPPDLPLLDRPLLVLPLLDPSLLDLPPVDLPASDLPLPDLAPHDLPLLDRPLLVLPLLDPTLLDLPPVDLPASDPPIPDLASHDLPLLDRPLLVLPLLDLSQLDLPPVDLPAPVLALPDLAPFDLPLSDLAPSDPPSSGLPLADLQFEPHTPSLRPARRVPRPIRPTIDVRLHDQVHETTAVDTTGDRLPASRAYRARIANHSDQTIRRCQLFFCNPMHIQVVSAPFDLAPGEHRDLPALRVIDEADEPHALLYFLDAETWHVAQGQAAWLPEPGHFKVKILSANAATAALDVKLSRSTGTPLAWTLIEATDAEKAPKAGRKPSIWAGANMFAEPNLAD